MLQVQRKEAEARTEFPQAEQVLEDVNTGLRERLYEAIGRVIPTENARIESKRLFAVLMLLETNCTVPLSAGFSEQMPCPRNVQPLPGNTKKSRPERIRSGSNVCIQFPMRKSRIFQPSEETPL